MRNKLIAACLIAALCFTFTACGNPKIEWGDDGMAFCAEYDYGLKAGSEGLMLGTLDKLNYSDLEGEQDTLKETTAKAIEEAVLGKYELEAFFEKLPESVEEAAEDTVADESFEDLFDTADEIIAEEELPAEEIPAPDRI